MKKFLKMQQRKSSKEQPRHMLFTRLGYLFCPMLVEIAYLQFIFNSWRELKYWWICLGRGFVGPFNGSFEARQRKEGASLLIGALWPFRLVILRGPLIYLFSNNSILFSNKYESNFFIYFLDFCYSLFLHFWKRSFENCERESEKHY